MEEKKKINWRRIVWRSINAIVALLVFIGVFALSVPAGISALIFSALGFGFGFWGRHYVMQKRFFDAFLTKKEDFFNGKVITITADEDTGEVTVVAEEVVNSPEEFVAETVPTVQENHNNARKKKHKKKEEVQEN